MHSKKEQYGKLNRNNSTNVVEPAREHLLFEPVAILPLSARMENFLQNRGINYLYELVGKTEGDLLLTKHFGNKSLQEIEEALLETGLGLGAEC